MNGPDSGLPRIRSSDAAPPILVVDDLRTERRLMVDGARQYLSQAYGISEDRARHLVSSHEGRESDDLYEWVNQYRDGLLVMDLRLGQALSAPDFDEDIRAQNMRNKIIFASGSDSPEMWWPLLCRDLSGRGFVVKYGNEEPFEHLPVRIQQALNDLAERDFHLCSILETRLQKLKDAAPAWVKNLFGRWDTFLSKRQSPNDPNNAATTMRLALEIEVLRQEQKIAELLGEDRLSGILSCAEHWKRYQYLAAGLSKLDTLEKSDRNSKRGKDRDSLESQIRNLNERYASFQLALEVQHKLQILQVVDQWITNKWDNGKPDEKKGREGWQVWLDAAHQAGEIDYDDYEMARRYCHEFSKSFSESRPPRYRSLEFGFATGKQQFRDHWTSVIPWGRPDQMLRARQLIAAWSAKGSAPPDKAEWASGAPPIQWPERAGS